MLEAFLRETPGESFGVWPVWLEWVVGSAVAFFMITGQIGFLGKLPLAPFLAGAAAWWVLHTIREGQISRLDSRKKLDFEKWNRVGRVRNILAQGAKLSTYLPVPVLESLEACARARFNALEEIRLSGDHVSLVAFNDDLNEEMALAIATAAIVTRRDDQAMKDVKRWEEDDDLMADIVRRIDTRRERMESVIVGLGSGSLRDNLARAKAEREAAERELDESLRQM